MAPFGNEVTNDQLVEEFNAVMTEVEQMLSAMPDAVGKKSTALRARLAGIAINLLAEPTAQPRSVRERTDRVGIDVYPES